MKHPRTNRVWLKRLLRGVSVLQVRVERGDALTRLVKLGLVQRIGPIVRLTPEGVLATGGLS